MSLEAFKGFKHTQSVASTTWTINHGLGTETPIVDCWIDVSGTFTKILPLSVVATSSTTVTITFSSAQSGRAMVA